MKKLILILNLLTYQIYANDFFANFTVGTSLFSNITEYDISHSDNSRDVQSSEVGSTRTNIGIGYSYDLHKKMVFCEIQLSYRYINGINV